MSVFYSPPFIFWLANAFLVLERYGKDPMVMNLMQTAETKFETGAERKEWVLAMVKASADTIDYDIDMDAISDLIDSLCNMSKVVNAPKA